MTPSLETIAAAIDTSPLNRGLRGVDWLASQGNIPVIFGNGDVALFDDEGDGDYEGHYLFKSRGQEAMRSAREALRTMFVEHEARMIFGLVPALRRDVKILTRKLGFRSHGLRATSEGPCELFILTRSMWKGAL